MTEFISEQEWASRTSKVATAEMHICKLPIIRSVVAIHKGVIGATISTNPVTGTRWLCDEESCGAVWECKLMDEPFVQDFAHWELEVPSKITNGSVPEYLKEPGTLGGPFCAWTQVYWRVPSSEYIEYQGARRRV